MSVYLRPILGGLKKRILGPSKAQREVGDGHSARYCYAVWLRHLIYLHRAGARGIPGTVAELGPGDSLGTGLAALLTGSTRYFACDVVRAAARDWNLMVLDGLVDLLRRRSPLPDQSEFPRLNPILNDYRFPFSILTDSHLEQALTPSRVDAIREALIHPDCSGDVEIRYQVPWDAGSVIHPGTVDVVFSQAVLEHVDDIAACYAAMAAWLKVGGYASHQIDFSSHDLAPEWNGHWSCSRPVWNIIRSGLPYLLNRAPCSAHETLLARNGLIVIARVPRIQENGLKRDQIRREFQQLTDDDLVTAGAYLLARKCA